MTGKSPDPRPVVLIPIYNDLESCEALLIQLESLYGPDHSLAGAVIVDDGSDRIRPVQWDQFVSQEMARTIPRTVVRLRRNVGHQRAIALGLCWVQAQSNLTGPVVVMDGDGEDLPTDVGRLIQALDQAALHNQAVVFAERRRRSEGVLFRVCYHTYRFLHLILTGIPVRFGNFSIISRDALNRIVVVNELWNHYAAAVVKSRLSYGTIPTVRGTRLAGNTQMNFTALVIHGLGALSVFAEVISVRLLIMVSLLLALLFSDAIPVLLAIALLQAAAIFIGLFFGLSALRSGGGLIPLRDYPLFILSVESDPSRQVSDNLPSSDPTQ